MNKNCYTFFASQGRFGDYGEWIPICSTLWGDLWEDVKDREGEMVTVTSGDAHKDTWVDIRFEDGFEMEKIYSRHLKLV